jgi:hypothetical protein
LELRTLESSLAVPWGSMWLASKMSDLLSLELRTLESSLAVPMRVDFELVCSFIQDNDEFL